MLLVDHIKQHGLQSLESKFAVRIKRGVEFPNLVLLKYDQLNTKMNDLTRMCRGIILDEDDDWNVVCYTYKRFANYGESWGDSVDWDTARVYTKEDGSLIQMYYYGGKWNVATSGTPDGSGPVADSKYTFAELFWDVWTRLGYSYPNSTDLCYAFELCTKYNKVVVAHPNSRIVLHGVRRLSDFRELNPVVEAYQNGWECVEIHSLDSWEDIQKVANEKEPSEHEGFVVCDANFNRAKVKSKAYVAVSRLKDSVGSSPRNMLDKIRINDCEEFLLHFPEMADDHHEMKYKYERLLGNIEGYYEAIKDIDDRKKFALKATAQKFSGALFALKFGKVNGIKEYLANMNIKTLEGWLG